MSVAIVILNYNGVQFLETFLPFVIQYSSGHEIIVADNCSTDNSIVFIEKQYPSIRTIRIPENKGYSAGYNYALSQIKSDYYILLNSDVEVSNNWIEPIITYMENDLSIAAAQPKILSYNDRNKFEYAGAAGGFIDKFGYPFCRGRIFSHTEEDMGQYNDLKEVFWATGACLFIRASVFHELNGFDDDFFAHMEEIDLCWRIQNKGYKIVCLPSSSVYHVGGGTLSTSSPKKTYLNFRNGLTMLLKNYSTRDLLLKFPIRIILDLVAAIQMLISSPKNSIEVLHAHLGFIRRLPMNFSKRRNNKNKISTKQLKNSFNSSIVFQNFIKGKSKFSDLNF